MAYSNTIKEAAFGFYCTGISFEEVAAEMKRQYPEECANITRQTIATWERKYNWAPRKEVIINRTKQKLDAKRISRRAEMIADLEDLEQMLFRHARVLQPKSLEGAINNLLSLNKRILTLRGEWGQDGRVAGKELEKLIATIFEVLSEDEKIGRLLVERQEFILDKIQGRLEAAQSA